MTYMQSSRLPVSFSRTAHSTPSKAKAQPILKTCGMGQPFLSEHSIMHGRCGSPTPCASISPTMPICRNTRLSIDRTTDVLLFRSEDLRNGPTIFIGAFDNAWTLRLTNTLRFHFANNADMSKYEIVDRSDDRRVALPI